MPSGVFEKFLFTFFDVPISLLAEGTDGMPQVEVSR
jgi:hypothetical protein